MAAAGVDQAGPLAAPAPGLFPPGRGGRRGRGAGFGRSLLGPRAGREVRTGADARRADDVGVIEAGDGGRGWRRGRRGGRRGRRRCRRGAAAGVAAGAGALRPGAIATGAPVWDGAGAAATPGRVGAGGATPASPASPARPAAPATGRNGTISPTES
ncbi:hypothetical protein I548_0950 [Mycobacterium intracellulare]|nr:hypothetical protein I548_0950 [Mycobacterium intracellulare]